jgi:hypothetical protein
LGTRTGEFLDILHFVKGGGGEFLGFRQSSRITPRWAVMGP